ncbi:hypothetical protein BH11PSE10_BH11PSE10_08140 [soil metagenome]
MQRDLDPCADAPRPRVRRPYGPVGMILLLLACMSLSAGAQTTLPVHWTAGGLSSGADSAGQAARLAVDSSGNIAVVSGPAGGRDLAVTSYATDGRLRWRSTVSPALGTFAGDWVAAAPDGDFVAVGHSRNSSGKPIGNTMVRYAANGALLWRVDFSASFLPSLARLMVDAAGNAYLAWSAVGSGLFVQKYSASGVLLWSQLDSTGSGYAVASSLALSPDGADVVATGSVSGGAQWITAVYDAANGARRWQVAAAEGTAARDVAVDTSHVYVTGQGVTNPGTPLMAYHLSVVAYDRATGARLWRTDSSPSSNSAGAIGLRIALAPDGSVAVAGTAGVYLDWWIVAINANGTLKWQVRRDRAGSGDEIPAAVFVLSDGTTVVSGIGGPKTAPDPLGNTYLQGVIAGYNPSGVELWNGFAKLGIAWAVPLPNGDLCAAGGYDALVTCWTVAAPPAPGAPSGLTARLASASILLSWLDNSSNETAFSIERCVGTGCTNFAVIGNQPVNATSYADPTYAAPGTNRYRVRASNAGGYSGYSGIAEEIVVVAGDPPIAVVSTQPSSGAAPLNVAFDGSRSTALGATIVNWAWSFGDGATGSGATVTHVYTAAGGYTATLTVTDSHGMSNSATTSISVTPGLLSAPVNLVATSTSRALINLAWINTSSSATSIGVERCRGSACTDFTTVAQLGAAATSWADSAVKSRSTYRYRLRASNASGSSPYSEIAAATAR